MTRAVRNILFSIWLVSAAQVAAAQVANRTKHAMAKAQMRELDWDTYVDKVEGAWAGKMIGVTFGQPWEFQYQGTPIGFDIRDWPLSPTRMKAERARTDNRDKGDVPPITTEADNQKVRINYEFVETSEKEHPSFGAPDNDDIYINLLFL